jgi:hypothetical protein
LFQDRDLEFGPLLQQRDALGRNRITNQNIHKMDAQCKPAVFVEQIGVPLPAVPWLFAAGALIGGIRQNELVCGAGRRHGRLVAGRFDLVLFGALITATVCWVCCAASPWSRTRASAGRRMCSRATECEARGGEIHSRFEHAGAAAGGQFRHQRPSISFLRWLGSLLYVGSFLLVGVSFSHQLEQIMAAFASLGSGALGLVAGLVALYIGYKYFQRRRLLRELRMARITVDELHQKLEAGENPMILDLRSSRGTGTGPFR